MFIIAHMGECVLILMMPLLFRWGDSLGASYILTLFAGILISFTILVHVARAFARDLDMLQKSLAEFRVQNAKCACCDSHHVDAWGEPLACDREVLLRCINVWFGSTENFDLRVQGPVRKTVLGNLTSPVHFYRRVVESACPVTYLFLARNEGVDPYSSPCKTPQMLA